MLTQEVIQIIEEFAPLSLAANWDKSGWQVASAKKNISTLAVCLDPTKDSIQSALELEADLILCHHPLNMLPRFPDKLDAYHDILWMLFKDQVGLYASHTSLDANHLGPVAWLAQDLGLLDLSILEPTGEFKWLGQTIEGGFGVIGKCELGLDVLHQCLQIYAPLARLIGTLPKQIKCLSICPGSGADLAALAYHKGAEVFITGDVKYHAALEFDLPVIDVGHFALEEEMMRRFARLLQQHSDLKVVFVAAKDPFSPF